MAPSWTLLLLLCAASLPLLVPAEKSLPIEGELEVLIADNFASGSHKYEVFLHQTNLNRRLRLNPDSFGHATGTLRTSMPARIWIKATELNEHRRTCDGGSADACNVVQEFNPIYDVSRFELFDTDTDELEGTRNTRKDQIPAWTIAILRRLLVIVVDFEDEQVKCSPQNISNVVWGVQNPALQGEEGPWRNVFRVFQVNSNNQYHYVRNRTFSSNIPSASPNDRDVVGPYRLNRKLKDERACNYEEWADLAIEMALDDGVEVSRYTQISFVLPNSDYIHTKLCRWTGLAHVGCGFLCRSWISDCASLGVFAHEFGHNAGFSHSGSSWGMKEPFVEYGDPTGIMGNQWAFPSYKNLDFYFNAIHRYQLGWLPSSKLVSLSARAAPQSALGVILSGHDFLSRYSISSAIVGYQSVNSTLRSNVESFPSGYTPFQDGSYFVASTARVFRLAPYHSSTLSLPQAIRISRSVNGNYYWVSFQSGNVPYAKHALIHYQASLKSSQTAIIHTVVPEYPPGNMTFDRVTKLFRDVDLTFALRVLQATDQFMDVQVTWRCENRLPLLKSRLPSPNTAHQWLQSDHIYVTALPSEPIKLVFLVTNMDSDLCRPATYLITTADTANLKWNCAPSTLVISPGGSCQFSCEASFPTLTLPTDPSTVSLRDITVRDGEKALERQLNVTFIGSNCVRKPPKLSLVTPALVSSVSWSTVSIEVQLENIDAHDCPSRSFWLEITPVDDWNQILPPSVSLRPAEVHRFTVAITPSISLQIGNMTTLRIVSASEEVGAALGGRSFLECSVRLVADCNRTMPSLEMADIGVAFYTRNTAVAPLRVTNMDTGDCGPSTFSVGISPDPTGYIQSSIFPSSIALNPGEIFDFRLAVTTPDIGRGITEQSRISTEIILLSSHPSIASSGISIAQNTWTVPAPCVSLVPSLGISCPTVNSITASTGVVSLDCGVAWKNNDPFLCSPSLFNYTITSISDTDWNTTHNVDGGELFLDASFSDSTARVIAGNTLYSSVTIRANMTGMFQRLESQNGTEEVVLMQFEFSVQDLAGNIQHSAQLSTPTIRFGRCLFASEPVLRLSQRTGPFEWVDQDTMLPPGEGSTPSLRLPNTPPVIIGPLIVMPLGVTRAVNWTISNPSSEYCPKSTFLPSLDPSSIEALNSMNIRYKLKPAVCDPGRSGEISLQLTAPATLPSSALNLVNITLNAQYALNSTTNTDTASSTVFLWVNNNCTVRNSLLEELRSDSPNGLAFRKFRYGDSVSISTTLNLTNADTIGCADPPFSIPAVFHLHAIPLWPTSLYPLQTDFAPIDSQGSLASNVTQPTPTSAVIPQEQSQLFNVTFSLLPGMPPGNYSIDIKSTTPSRLEHGSSLRLTFEVLSDPPRPVWDLSAYEVTTKLSGAIGHDIQWRACERDGECHCPCTFNVFINGVLKATVDETMYRYRYSASQAGVLTNVDVIVIDQFGRESAASPSACQSRLSFTPSDSSFAHLFIFLVLVAVLLFPSILLLIEWLRHLGRLPLADLEFDPPPDFNALEMLELNGKEE